MLDVLWILVCAGLVFLMQAGFMCLESGMTRSKNNINVAVKNLADFGFSVGLFWLLGYGLMFGASLQGWIGWQPPMSNQASAIAIALFLFQAMFCGTAITIISGAVAERLRVAGYIVVVTLASGLIYPLFGHWAWNGLPTGMATGWLAQLGFVDFAGSTVVHGIGAWIALAALWHIGPRQGRYAEAGDPVKIQGSDMPFSVLGALLLWFGWLGFNGGSTLAWSDQVPAILLNTVMAGVAGMLTAAGLSWRRYGLVEVEGLINGSIAGLVAITAGCHALPTPLAILVGAIGAIVADTVAHQLVRRGIDDAVDAIAVHGGAGAWGTLAVGLFGSLEQLGTGLPRLTQVGVQLLGIATAGLWAFGLAWSVLWLVRRWLPLRVTLAEEEVGLNISEHRAKTATYDLLNVMDQQAQTLDLSLRVPVESFTEVGHIATRYNQVMDRLEEQHQDRVIDLDQLYTLTELMRSALVTEGLTADQQAELQAIAAADTDLGQLAHILQQLLAPRSTV